MKKLITFLLFSCLATVAIAQSPVRITGLKTFSINTTSSTPMSAVDNSYENLVFAPILNESYDITRPNKAITVTGDINFNMNDITPGKTGTVRFTLVTGAEIIILNGKLNTTLPTSPGTFTLTYSNTSGTINWN